MRSKYESELTWEELERAIEDTSNNKAAGNDNIPYDIIKSLGAKAKVFILHLFNQVWKGEPMPQQWRTAVIKPLLKDGKDPKSPGSFRPIALTWCLGKLLEKIVADRLTSYLECNNLINPNQAGFRKERCTTDQVLKLVQMASDKMHENKDGTTTLVTFFDFSRAYDKVWREGLIHKMIKLKVPYSFVRYTRLFLSARKTMVEINGARSKPFFLNEGLPQGSAISPLLFLIFINDITEFTDEKATPSLFADDTAIWVGASKDKEESIQEMQRNINAISNWAKKWKMVLNSDKTQVMVLSTSPEDTNWKPELLLDKKKLKVVKEYRFLGVLIDNQLRFNAHVKQIATKCKKRNNILRCLAGKDWGQSLDCQLSMYFTYIRSALEYASPSWYPWITQTAKLHLERIQNESLRIMTRMSKDTPVDFLRLQAGVEPITDRLEKNCKIMRERYARLEETDSRRRLAEKKVKRRLTTRKGWRDMTDEVMRNDINRNMERTSVDPMTPVNIEMTEVKLEKKKDAYTEEELRRQTECKIAEVNADIEIYTDGSTSGDQRKGGAGIFIQNREGTILMEKSIPAGSLCLSYDGESVACLEALRWIENQRQDVKYAIFTDSKSLTTALSSNKWKITHEWLKQIKNVLQKLKQTVTVCWVPSHCGTYGNEKADKLADTGASMSQTEAPVTFSIVQAKIRNVKWKIQHKRAADMFDERRKPKEEEKNWTENIRRTYARLRCDHAKELKAYQKRIEITNDGKCTHCDMNEEETIEHVLCRCPQLEAVRRREWPEPFTTKMLVANPELCRKVLARRFAALRRIGELEEMNIGGPSDRTAHLA